MKLNHKFALLLAGAVLAGSLTGCGASGAPASSAASSEAAASSAVSEAASEPTAEAALPDGVYTADFDTDSSMFHANEANDGKGTLSCVSFFIGGNSEDEYAATRCRRSHLSGSKNPAVGLPLAGNGCIPLM